MNNRWRKQGKMLARQITKELDIYEFATSGAGCTEYSERLEINSCERLGKLYDKLIKVVPENKRECVQKRRWYYYYGYQRFDKVKWLEELCESIFGIYPWDEL